MAAPKGIIRKSVVSKIGGVTVHVRDIKKAIRFYGDVLGLTLKYKDEAHNYVEFNLKPTLGIHVGTPDERGREPGGATGISFEVDDIYAVVKELKKRKVKVTEPKDEGWAIEAELEDPDGNRFLLFQEKK